MSETPKAPEPGKKLGELFQEWLKEHNAEIVVRVVTPLADAHCDPMNFIPAGWRVVYDAVPVKA
jgi:hypothetical protein